MEPRWLCAATLQVLASLGTSTDPLESQSGIAVDAAGDVFGTAFRYGETVGQTFTLASGAASITTTGTFPVDFALDAPNDDLPIGRVVRDAAGDLFGLTGGPFGTGPNATGSLWELPAGASTPVLLHKFDVLASPESLTIDAAGNVYGSARATSTGAVVWWEYPADGTGLRQLTATDGTGLGTSLVADATGNLYGLNITASGGFHGFNETYGADLIEIPAAAVATAAATGVSAAPITLTPDLTTGNAAACNLVIDSAGNLYASGGNAILYRPAGGQLRQLATLPSNAPYGIASDPLVDANGDLFVVASQPDINGAQPQMFVLEAVAGSSVLSPIATIPNANPPFDAGPDLAADAAGNLYGLYNVGRAYADTQSRVYEVTGAFATATAANASPLQPTVTSKPSPLTLFTADPHPHRRLTVTLTDAASTPITARTTVTVFATDAGTITAASIPIATVTRRVSLRANRAMRFALPIASAPAVAGSYTLVARVTDAAGRSSNSAVGGTLTVADPIVAFRGTLATTTSRVAVGGWIDLALRVTNVGPQNSIGNVEFAFSALGPTPAAGMALTTVDRPLKLPAGRTATLQFRVSLPPTLPPGDYQPTVTLSAGVTEMTATSLKTLTVVG